MHDPILSSMLRINRHRLQRMKAGLLSYGFVGTMHLILVYTGNKPGSNQEEVAKYYALDKGSVARDTLRLERMGYIQREIAPSDRRKYQLFITEEGKKMLPNLYRLNDDFYAQISEGFSNEELNTLADLLRRMEEKAANMESP